jgi:hypothetical protein
MINGIPETCMPPFLAHQALSAPPPILHMLVSGVSKAGVHAALQPHMTWRTGCMPVCLATAPHSASTCSPHHIIPVCLPCYSTRSLPLHPPPHTHLPKFSQAPESTPGGVDFPHPCLPGCLHRSQLLRNTGLLH